MHSHLRKLLACTTLALLSPCLLGQDLDGTWVADAERSVDNDPWRRFELVLTVTDDSATIDRFWQGTSRYTQRDSITVPLDETVVIPARPGKWMNQVYLGVFVPEGAERSVMASLSDDADSLVVTTRMPLTTSQSKVAVTVRDTYTIGSDGNELILTENRSSRKTGPELRTILKRK